MIIPQTQSGQSTNQDIPPWIKNNAGWWADGLLSDQEFSNALKFLVTSDIIQI